MAKRDKYRKNKASDFFDYTEGKLSDKERNALERRMQKDPFESDAAEGFSKVSREEAAQDLHFAEGSIHGRIAGAGSRSGSNRRIAGAGSRANRNRRIAWYSAAAAIASLMIVTTVFFRLNDNGLERFETAPEMREAAREQSTPLQKGKVEQEGSVDEDALDQEGYVDQEALVSENAIEREDPVQETLVEQEEMVQEDNTKEKSETFPVTAGPDAKKGYDLKEMQMHQEDQAMDREAQALAKPPPAVSENRQKIGEDHAFACEKMEEEAAAGRYNETQQRMATAKAPTEQKTAYDLQAPMAAKDNVTREQTVADISYRPTGTVSGVVKSADDLEPLPGAVVKLKDSETGTVADLEGRFTMDVTTDNEETLEVSYIGMKPETVRATTDQPVEIALIPDEISLDEVVVIGYDSSKKSQLTASSTAVEVEPSGTVNFESAVPTNGHTDFRNYIDSTLVYPEPTETSGKEVVVLKFTVSPDGRPQNFRVIRAPDNEAFEKEAIRVVSEGPAWQPATRNGQHTEEEVRLRIVFRKD